MKYLFSLVALFILSFAKLDAQDVKMTFTAGVSPEQTPPPHHIFVNRSSPRDEFMFDLAQVKASYFVGFGAKYDLAPFFLAAEAQYNKREYVYSIAYTFPGFGRSEETQLLTESMNVINVPLSVGVDLGVVDVVSGFLPQLILSSDSDLADLEGYSGKPDFLRFGMHSGVAYNINDLRLGVSWQMDFNRYADHAAIRNQNLALSGRSTRILGTLSYVF